MRAAALIAAALCSVARADKIVVLTERGALPQALQVALADRRVAIETQPAPGGALRLERAAAAQHAALADRAQAAVWIDGGDVWVASSDGQFVRHAPIPADATPRAFAAIAASLLDGLVAPAPGSPIAPLPPATRILADAPPATVPAEPWRRAALEVGGAMSKSSYGVDGELLWPVAEHVRIGVLGELDRVSSELSGRFLAGTLLSRAGGELRYVGGGATRVQLGFTGGILHGTPEIMGGASDVYAQSPTAGFMSLSLGGARDLGPGYVAVAVEPMLIFDSLSQNAIAVMGSLRVGLPL